jgi:hypothetical protein
MNRYTFEESIDLYRRMGELERRMIRSLASRRLVQRGAEEVGTSDINHELCAICNEYNGSFVEFLEDHLSDFLDGYKSLA